MNESVKHLRRLGVVALFWIVLLFVTLSAATYAWFTSNNRVTTNRVSAHTSTESVALQISETGPEDFVPGEVCGLPQVNGTDAEYLLPVSTADLQTFFYLVSSGESSSVFRTVSDENYYFHGRIYLRAVANEAAGSSQMALFLDDSAETGVLAANESTGKLLNAARLGLAFNGGSEKIFYLSAESNPSGEQIRNTYLNGVPVADGSVLAGTAGNVIAVADPALPLSACTVSVSGSDVVLPDQPLCYLDVNTVYTVDVYFYLEGCDPDCSDAVSFDAADLHLAFYGVLS